MDANKKIEEIKEIVNEEVKKNKDVKLDVRGINSIIKITSNRVIYGNYPNYIFWYSIR